MPNLNKVMLMGNLTRDPEVKYTPKGTAVVNFGIAVNRTYTVGDSGERREEVTFVDIEAFGRTAEIIGEYFKKGRPIFVEGRLKLDTWDDKQTGKKMSKLRVIVDSFEFLGGKRDGDGEESAAGETAEQPTGGKKSPPPQRKPPVDPDLDAAEDDIPF